MGEAVKIGIVGAGRMGANIALRLHEVGYPIAAVHDARAESALRAAKRVGAKPAVDLSEVTAASDVIVTVVSDDAAMRSIYAQSADSLLRAARGKLFIQCATLTPTLLVELEAMLEAEGAQSIEACMAGSMPQAREGTLYVMAGGRREAFQRAEPILKAMSSALRYIGPAGSAAKVKALVNMLMNINTAGLAEALGLGEALGLELTMLRDVFAQTGAASRVLQTDGADMQEREHEVYFSAVHAAKDSHIANALAEEVGLSVPLSTVTASQYDHLVELGLGELDKSAIAELTFPSRRAPIYATR